MKDSRRMKLALVQLDSLKGDVDGNLDKIEAVAATEKTEGNKEYYECKDCGKYFEDAQGTKEVTKESMVIPKLSPQPTTSPTASSTVALTAISVRAIRSPARRLPR